MYMYKEIIPIKLKQARIEAGYTQQQLADEIEINRENISRYENGIVEPSIEILGKLCDFLEVSADWLIGTKFGTRR